jgi:anhydro-N-acetylmuramic acid kinase
LVPIFDYVVLRSRTRSRLALNIGGIANLTAIPRNGAPTAMVSFDTGPGNCMIDTAIRRLSRGRLDFDRGGAWAAKGRVDRALLAEILRHPYFRQRPPKSTGWEQFGVNYTDRLLARGKARGLDKYSMVSTVSEAVAESIARAIAAFVGPMMTPDEVIATGGGAKNRFLMGSLSQKLVTRFPRLKIAGGEAFGIDSDAKEACAFAYLAYLCLEGIPANVASQAAGLKPAVLGAIYPGPPGSGPQTRSSPHRRRLRC